MQKGALAMLGLPDAAEKVAIPAKYVLFDSWFSSLNTLHAVKKTGYDVIGMVKKHQSCLCPQSQQTEGISMTHFHRYFSG